MGKGGGGRKGGGGKEGGRGGNWPGKTGNPSGDGRGNSTRPK
jgi:hypothetical protein